MKKIYTNLVFLLLLAFIATNATAQDRRTMETKVADILAQFPAEDIDHTNRLMAEMLDLGDEGILQFCAMIIPPGSGDDTQARYALESLARYSGAPNREDARDVTEKVLLRALEQADDKEVQAFFIRRLIYCGSNASVTVLEGYITDPKLFSPAISTLVSIGTPKAAEALQNKLSTVSGEAHVQLIKAIGVLRPKEAVPALIPYTGSSTTEVRRQALYALASIGQPEAYDAMVDAAVRAGYKAEAGESMVAYIRYAKQLAQNGHIDESNKLAKNLLKQCTGEEQMHFRSAGMDILRNNQGTAVNALLIKEFRNEDMAYRQAVLNAATANMISSEIGSWIKAAKKASLTAKAQLIHALARRTESEVLADLIMPALNDEAVEVRLAAIEALAINQQEKAIPTLIELLKSPLSDSELAAIKDALLQTCDADACARLAAAFDSVNDDAKVVMVEVMASKHASDNFELVLSNCKDESGKVQQASFEALQFVASPGDLQTLIELLETTSDDSQLVATQQAIVQALGGTDATNNALLFEALQKQEDKSKLIPVLPFVRADKALETVTQLLSGGNGKEQAAAYTALIEWQTADALPVLYKVLESGQFADSHTQTLAAYLEQIALADFPDDQKLLLIRKVMPLANTAQEKTLVLDAAGNVKTFLSLVFVADYLEDEQLAATASSAAMRIAMPSIGSNDGLSGRYVRQVAEKVMANLQGPDSQYFKIDIREYLEKMPMEEGYVSIFNGRDLSGWQGLVENPIERAKMSEKELSRKQQKANEEMHENWTVKDGVIVFNGKGHNLCTVRKYGDFELLVDWRISKDGDSGIYLRGSPQVQIWDWTRKDAASSVGSGGLFNNKNHPDKPLVVADNPIGDWNTFRIKMVGERVTVYLNGQLVVDDVIMENYWDRSLPIFPKEAIELQAHGNELAFRNIWVKEIGSGAELLTEEEKAEGFVALFNGQNLDGWVGNKTDYLVQDNMIAVRPEQGGHGNLFTEKEYTNYIFRFEFQLTPGANNGLGIRAPLEGDGAYEGIELQILDNTAPIYANLEPYQYHGSAYGIIPAKRGYLAPVGDWNEQEVIVNGDDIKVTLNGHVILEGNLKEASKNGTLDKKEHPGLKRNAGHIGFLGHGSELQFRNIRIKELPE